jgi:hypothetical protein
MVFYSKIGNAERPVLRGPWAKIKDLTNGLRKKQRPQKSPIGI